MAIASRTLGSMAKNTTLLHDSVIDVLLREAERQASTPKRKGPDWLDVPIKTKADAKSAIQELLRGHKQTSTQVGWLTTITLIFLVTLALAVVGYYIELFYRLRDVENRYIESENKMQIENKIFQQDILSSIERDNQKIEDMRTEAQKNTDRIPDLIELQILRLEKDGGGTNKK